MAENAGGGKQKVEYNYPGHEADDTAIDKVESALKSKFPDSFKEGLANSTKDAPIKEEEAQGKIEKAKQDANEEAKNNPQKVADEAKTDPPPPMQAGGPKPQIQTHSPTTAGPKGPAGGGAKAPAPKAPAKTGPAGGKGAAPVPAPPQPIAIQAAATGDANLDKFLNDYSPKSKEPTERLSKIKEMAETAKGFDGKVDEYIKNGGGPMEAMKGAAINFLGKKEMDQTFGDNPYDKVKDRLGGIMAGISRVQGFVSLVGGICGKLGLVLTILGLFGFIFPPIGAAIQAVARVLNVVGLICDALGLILSGVLVGLNGVVLARTIGKNGSNEEKAALADQMMGEANAAGGHIMNLAMAYGGKFMAGLKSASKGVIASLMKRFKGIVGKFASKTLGPVVNWAKKIGYKFGFGLEKAASTAAPGAIKKGLTKAATWTADKAKAAWNAPGKLIEKAKETNFVKNVNAKTQGLDRLAAKTNNSWFAKLDGEGLEHLGKKAGGAVFTKNLEKRMEASAQVEAREAMEAAEKNAVKDAANKEKAQIQRSLKEQRAAGNEMYEKSISGPQLNEGQAVKSREMYEAADKLEKDEAKMVAKAEKKAAKESQAEWQAENAAEQKAKKEEAEKAAREHKDKEDWKEDPEKFQEKTKRLEREMKDKERLANSDKANPKRKEVAKAEAEALKEKIEERKQIGAVAGGRETEKPETLWDLGKKGIYDPIHEKNEEAEKDEKKEEYIEGSKGWEWGFNVSSGSGGHADHEAMESKETSEKIEEWQKPHDGEGLSTSSQVDGLLAGLDDDLGLEPANPDADHDDDHGGQDTAVTDSADDQKADTNASSAAATSAPAPKEEAKEEQKEAPKDAETPELAYWPKLTEEFAKSAAELGRMKTIAYGFRKAQAEAKKKAIEAAQTFNEQGKYAAKKEDHAGEHGKAIADTTNESSSNSGASAKTGAKADEGKAKQNEGQTSANGSAQEGPDPGSKPGLLHPIKRIWWYVKKWVSDKAAAVFGWIQEKIASMVLKVVCGISMGDLKGYTTALHNRMEYSKLVGAQGKEKADETMKKSLADKGKTKTYEEQAIEDAAECDQNMADADAFVKEVEETERDLVAEKARAAQFIESLHVAVQAEKARQEAEAQKKADEKKAQNAAAQNGDAGVPAPVAGVPKAPSASDKWKQNEPKPLNPAALSKVKSAADYVVAQTSKIIDQLNSSKQEQAAQLSAKAHMFASFGLGKVGDDVMSTAKSSANEITSSMSPIKSANPTTAAELQRLAGQIKGKASQVDSFAHVAHEGLNAAFKSTYDNLKKAKQAS